MPSCARACPSSAGAPGAGGAERCGEAAASSATHASDARTNARTRIGPDLSAKLSAFRVGLLTRPRTTLVKQGNARHEVFIEDAHVPSGLFGARTDLVTQDPPRFLVARADLVAQRALDLVVAGPHFRPRCRKLTAHLVPKLHQLQLHGGDSLRQGLEELHFFSRISMRSITDRCCIDHVLDGPVCEPHTRRTTIHRLVRAGNDPVSL